MAYSVNNTTKELVWDSNPRGTSVAVIKDGQLQELLITNEYEMQVVLTLDITLLDHIKQVITDLQTELTPQ